MSEIINVLAEEKKSQEEESEKSVIVRNTQLITRGHIQSFTSTTTTVAFGSFVQLVVPVGLIEPAVENSITC